MDIDSAEVFSIQAGEPLNLAAHPRIADIATRIDGELLDSIGRLWYRGKGWPDPELEFRPAKAIATMGWKPGELLAWDDVCKGLRQDIYVLDDRVYEAMELYCPVADCECGEVSVSFEALVPLGRPRPDGSWCSARARRKASRKRIIAAAWNNFGPRSGSGTRTLLRASRTATSPASGTRTAVRSRLRASRAISSASRRSVLMRSPGLRGIDDGALTATVNPSFAKCW